MGFGRWQPSTVRKFVKGFPTSARTALVETDIGLGYLKGMGGPEGLHILAAEVIATQLADWLGLPTFDCAIITLDEIDEIPFFDKDRNQTGQALPGAAFIARHERGGTWSGGKRDLLKLINPEDISALVVFDTWVLNCDRYAPKPKGEFGHPRVNRDNVFFSEDAPEGQFLLKAMDHTHCFSCGRSWTRRLSQIDKLKEERIFGLFPEFRPFLKPEAVVRATDKMRSIDRATVAEMVELLPNDWDVSRGASDALIDLILGRAKFVADTIEKRIWPQGSLLAEEEEDAEPTP
jgi:hypothetical protein